MSSEIYENRDAGLIVPQFRTRPLIFEDNVEPINTPRRILAVSDIVLEYLNIAVIGAAESIRVDINADGLAVLGIVPQIANNRYGWYLDPEADNLNAQNTVAVGFILCKYGIPWPAHNITIDVQQTTAAGGVQVVSRVRYSQL